MVTSRPASPPHLIPSSIQGFLRTLLQLNPCLGHALLQSLTITDSPNYIQNNETLQLLYIECIDISLGKIDGRIHDDTVQSDKGVATNNEVECICNWLSLIDPTPEMTRVVKSIDRIFSKLMQLKSCDDDSVNLFNSELIYSCIIGRSSFLLVQRFQDIEQFLRSNQNNEGVELNVIEDSDEYWKKEFYLSLKQKQHFLERVMVSLLYCNFTHNYIYY